MQPGGRRDDAFFEREPAADALVSRDDLGDDIVLLQARAELRMPLSRPFEELRRSE